MLTVLVLCCTLLLSSTAQEPIASFEGDQVIRVSPVNEQELHFLQHIHIHNDQIDFWTDPAAVGHNVDIHVPKSHLNNIKQRLVGAGLSYQILIQDVQKAITAELSSMNVTKTKQRSKQRSKRDIEENEEDEVTNLESLTEEVLEDFGSYQKINEWLDKISEFCGSKCHIHNIGYSGEGRQLKVIQIGNLRRRNTKGAVWIEAGIHAREWIAPATANNIIYKLINPSERCDRRVSDSLVWYILPVANPDGYEYSQNRNRMWRKNRRVTVSPRRPWWTVYYYGSDYRYCYGVDLNRNFGFKWGETGTSMNPCSDIYGGSEAFSEPETDAIKTFLSNVSTQTQIKAYLSLHAYGQYWLYSWGYTRQLPEDHQLLHAVASASTRAIHEASDRRTTYITGPASRTLYASSGASDDWAKGSLGVKYSFTLELPPSDSNAQGNGFLVPTSAIPHIAAETWPGVRAMASSILHSDGQGFKTPCH